MNTSLYRIANEYIRFKIGRRSMHVPYVIAGYAVKKYGLSIDTIHAATTEKFKNYGGKGTPEQIRRALLFEAKRERFDVFKETPQQIYQFMEKKGIGIDCSGFAYNVLKKYFYTKKHKNLDTLILRYSGLFGKIERFFLQHSRVRRISAETLTNSLNTIQIMKVKDMRPGDILRLTHADWKGKHVAVIVAVNERRILYAMASEYTKTKGSHFGEIIISNSNEGLEKQRWLETTKNGKNYGKDVFDPKRGDSVRRLKYFC